MLKYIVVALVAAVVTGGLIPVARRIALKYRVVAEPDEARRLHKQTTPLLGGAAMCVAVLVGLFVASFFTEFDGIFRSSAEPFGIAIAAILITIVGVIDDIFEISAPAKLAGMVVAGSVLNFFGVVMYYVRVPFLGILSLSPDVVPLLTVIWVIGMANAINLIDGLDGLAAGTVAISAGAFFLYGDRLFKAGLLPGDNIGPLIAAITVGICAGFLPWNFSPARIFMGDAGAQLLGLLLASSTMVVGGRADPTSAFRGQTYFFVAPMFIPFIILAVPMFDTAFAIVRRTISGRGAAIADRQHIHHRLIDLGHGPRRAVIILWSLTAIFSSLALLPTYISSRWPLIPLGALFLLTMAFAVLHKDSKIWKRGRVLSPNHPAELAAQGIVDLTSRRAEKAGRTENADSSATAAGD